MDHDIVIQKPKLRGVLDIIGAAAALPAGITLFTVAPPGPASWGTAIYGPSLFFLLAVSATYHTPTWTPQVRAWLRRLDHAAIFILIAGTYTPIVMLTMPPTEGRLLLALVWSAAGGGVAVSLAWTKPPRFLLVAACVALGWLILPFGHTVLEALDPIGVVLLGIGGLFYSTGGIAYATHWPNPIPGIFGYHEVFHALVIAAAVCHYAVIWRLVN